MLLLPIDPIGTIIGLAGILVGWVFYRLHLRELRRLQARAHADWGDIQYGVQKIRARLLDDAFVPDIFICPLGTSLFVTELLALSLESKNPDIPIHVLEALPSDAPGKFIGDGKPFDVESTGYRYLIPWHFAKLRGKRALVFDDGAVTGKTLLQFKKQLGEPPFEIDVRTAVLFASEGIKKLAEEQQPDYSHRWVYINDFQMPWGRILQDDRAPEAQGRPRAHKSIPSESSQAIKDLGNFPAFFPTIVESIGSAPDNSPIQIACDYVSYGVFNAGPISDNYRDSLIAAKRRGCTVQMLVLGSDAWEQMIAHVSDHDEKQFQEMQNNDVYKNNLNAFAKRMLDLNFSPPEKWTRADLLRAQIEVEHFYHRKLESAGVQITIVQGPLPLYLWITKSSAVCALCPLEPIMRFRFIWSDVLAKNTIDLASPWDERGFLSRDGGLVHRFAHVWRQYTTTASVDSSMAKVPKGASSTQTLSSHNATVLFRACCFVRFV